MLEGWPWIKNKKLQSNIKTIVFFPQNQMTTRTKTPYMCNFMYEHEAFDADFLRMVKASGLPNQGPRHINIKRSKKSTFYLHKSPCIVTRPKHCNMVILKSS